MAKRTPLQKLLPESVVRELDSVARSATQVDHQLVVEVDTRLDLANRYGVSRRRLRNYLLRVRTTSGANDTGRDVAAPEAPGALIRHRRRQASVSAVLEAMFGNLADCDPDLWDRRAYSMLVGLVYERLALNEQEISTDELVALAKILAESRRVSVRADEAPRVGKDTGQPASLTGPLPGEFANIVRQVYGTNFQSPGETESSEDCPPGERAGPDGVGG